MSFSSNRQVGKALSLFERGRPEAALKRLNKALRIDPNSVPAHAFLGDYHAGKEEWEKAERAYRRVIEINPEFDNKHFKKAQRIDPNYDPEADIYRRLSRTLMQQGKDEEGSEYAEMADKREKTLGTGIYALFPDAVREIEDEKREIGRLEKELETNETIEAHIKLAELTQNSNRSKSREHYERALELDPTNLEIKYQHALTLDQKEAKEELEKILDSDPNHTGALSSLGFLYQYEFGDPNKAAELYKQILEIKPDHKPTQRDLEEVARALA